MFVSNHNAGRKASNTQQVVNFFRCGIATRPSVTNRAVVVRPIIVKTPRVYQRRKNDPRQNERRISCHVSGHVGRKSRQRKEPCSVNTHIFSVNIDRISGRLMIQEQLRGALLFPQDDNEVGRPRNEGTKES